MNSHGGFQVGDRVETLKDLCRSPWPGKDFVIPKGTVAKVTRLSPLIRDVVWIAVGEESDPFGDHWIAINVRALRPTSSVHGRPRFRVNSGGSSGISKQ